MKMRKTGIFSLLVAFILVVSACGGNGNSGKETGNTTGTDASSGNSGEKTKLVVWVWDSARKPLDLNLEAFQAKYPNIEIEYQVNPSGDIFKKFLVSSTSGDAVPDIIASESSTLAKLVDVDSLLDITDRVAPYKDKMNEFKFTDATKDGKIYAMPWDSGPVALFYRNDLFAKAGLPSKPEEVEQKLQTFEDFYEAGKLIKEKTGASLISDSKTASNNRFFETIMWQRGLWYFDNNGNVKLDSPEVVQIGEYIKKLTDEGLVYDAEPWGDSWLNSLKAGKVAAIVGASWFDGVLSGWVAPDDAGKWSVAKMPKWSKDDQYASANDGGSVLAINKHSEHPEEAWKFIEFMLGGEQEQLNMAVEGGLFPALESVYNETEFKQPSAYFGGQDVRSVFAEAVNQIYPQAYTKDFPTANELTTDAFAQVFLKNKPVSEAFKDAAAKLKESTGRQ